jgi:hypothetical protein
LRTRRNALAPNPGETADDTGHAEHEHHAAEGLHGGECIDGPEKG